MKTKDFENAIKEVIERTFRSITNLYNDQNKETRLIFPHYYDRDGKKGEKRVSEQELRQIFIEELTKYAVEHKFDDLRYSVETPTKKKYRFPENDNPQVCEKGESGVSARFDLTIEMNGKIAAIIEFKAGNASKHDYNKDICKLANPDEGEKDTLRCFINVLEDSNMKTFDNIYGKYKECKKGKETIHLWLLSMGVHRHSNSILKEYTY